ncbi:MAG: hypothetical protein AAGG68_13425 [Bacteroidota bacterium]
MEKIILSIALIAISISSLYAQSNIGAQISTSKSDDYDSIIWYQQQISERFSAGLQVRASELKYRFINAQAVESGNTFFTGLVLGFKLKETENYRLDFNTTASWRRINSENSSLPETASGLEIDPNLIFGLRLNDQFFYHSGMMLRAALQLSPETIGDEQLPSAILLNSFSYQLNAQTLSFKTYFGPMNGASGDTEKFFWQLAVSYQYNLNYKGQGRIPFLNF